MVAPNFNLTAIKPPPRLHPTVPQTAVPAVWDGHPTTQNANSNFNKIDGGIDSIMQNFGLNVFQWLILASYHHKSLNSWFFPEIIE